MDKCIDCDRNKKLEIQKSQQEYNDRKQKLEYEKLQKEFKKSIKQKSKELKIAEIKRLSLINVNNIELLCKLTPYEFEDVISEMYKKLGYDANQTPYSNDGGKDIILFKDGKKFLVECKKYNFRNNVGREDLQKFFAAIIEEEADKGFFVTTSDFLGTAILYAEKVKDIKNIELINGNKLISIMQKAYPEKCNSKYVNVMCEECGEVIIFEENKRNRLCKKGHEVINELDTQTLLPKYLK